MPAKFLKEFPECIESVSLVSVIQILKEINKINYTLIWVNKDGINTNGCIDTFDWHHFNNVSLILRGLAEVAKRNRGINNRVERMLS